MSGAHKTLRHIKKEHDELGTEFVFNRTVSSLLLANDGIVEQSTNSVVADGKTEDLRHHVPIVVSYSTKALADLFRKPVVVLIVHNQHDDIHGDFDLANISAAIGKPQLQVLQRCFDQIGVRVHGDLVLREEYSHFFVGWCMLVVSLEVSDRIGEGCDPSIQRRQRNHG
ncbi:unnamed protein product [Laminaria digitata]